MLALLPEFEAPTRREPIHGIVGPKLTGVRLTAELVQDVRQIELGKQEPPELVVDRASRRLCLHPEFCTQDQNLHAWVVYKLGSFSTAPVRWVDLNSRQRTVNSTYTAEVQLRISRELVEQIGPEAADGMVDEVGDGDIFAANLDYDDDLFEDEGPPPEEEEEEEPRD